jgi:hypothetical protein
MSRLLATKLQETLLRFYPNVLEAIVLCSAVTPLIARMEPSIVERIDEDLDWTPKRKSCFDSSTNSSWRARPLICLIYAFAGSNPALPKPL